MHKSILCTNRAYSDQEAHKQLYLSYVSFGLLQCTIHGAAVEDHVEYATGPEYDHVGNFTSAICLCNTSAMQATLGSLCFWMQIKVLVISYKALHGTEPRYLQDCLFLTLSATVFDRL